MALLCWATFGLFFFVFGSRVFENKGLTGSPVLIHILRSFLATSFWYSWYHALTFGYQIPYIPQLATLQNIPVRLLVDHLKRFSTSDVFFFLLTVYVVTIWPLCMMKVGVQSTFSFFLVLATLYIRGTYWAKYRDSVEEWLTNSDSIAAHLWRKRRIVEFGVGMLGSILFQNFLKLTTMEHVVDFLLLALAWVCTILVVLPPTDFGILSFLLSNVCLGCTMNIYGIKRQTWIVYAICLLILLLHSMLKIFVLACTKWIEIESEKFASEEILAQELDLPSLENLASEEILARV